jgi:pimeloyl-ACP methyl ester carboxylesterase
MVLTMGSRFTKPWVLLALLLACVSGIAQAAPASGGEQPIALDTAGGKVAGTLRLPPGAAKAPAVLIIAGSGPTDRDGNVAMLPGHNDSLKMLAEALAQAGFASVRYDKRGIGESRAAAPDESQLRFDTYVTDAAAWIAQMKADPRFSSVAVIGHSEGALIGMLAAERAGASAYVSLGWPKGRGRSCASRWSASCRRRSPPTTNAFSPAWSRASRPPMCRPRWRPCTAPACSLT